MKTYLILSEEDQRELYSIIKLRASGPKPTQNQGSALRKILSRATKPHSSDEVESWIGLGDRISLVSPKDSSDYFNLRIVMPGEANPEQDLISILTSISLAAIGRRCGEKIYWETPRGTREMRIVSVFKAEEMFA